MTRVLGFSIQNSHCWHADSQATSLTRVEHVWGVIGILAGVWLKCWRRFRIRAAKGKQVCDASGRSRKQTGAVAQWLLSCLQHGRALNRILEAVVLVRAARGLGLAKSQRSKWLVLSHQPELKFSHLAPKLDETAVAPFDTQAHLYVGSRWNASNFISFSFGLRKSSPERSCCGWYRAIYRELIGSFMASRLIIIYRRRDRTWAKNYEGSRSSDQITGKSTASAKLHADPRRRCQEYTKKTAVRHCVYLSPS